jgi:hypothetical protein
MLQLYWNYAKSSYYDMAKYVGKTIDGVVITPSAILAGSHLVGAPEMKKYLVSNGTTVSADGYGTQVSKYVKLFAGYATPFDTQVSTPSQPAPSTPEPAPAGTGVLKLTVSGEHYNGAPAMNVTVDGKYVGYYKVTADLRQAKWQDISIKGNWADGVDHVVKVTFLNDSYGGSATADRNLYVKSASLNGVSVGTQTKLGKSGESLTWTLKDSATVPPSAPSEDTITVKVSGEAYLGDPNFAFIFDGKTIDATNVVTADYKAGELQTFTFKGDFDSDGIQNHQVGIKFTNDLYGGSTTKDRNLFVEEVTFNGVKNDTDHLFKSNGAFSWDFNL